MGRWTLTGIRYAELFLLVGIFFRVIVVLVIKVVIHMININNIASRVLQ